MHAHTAVPVVRQVEKVLPYCQARTCWGRQMEGLREMGTRPGNMGL